MASPFLKTKKAFRVGKGCEALVREARTALNAFFTFKVSAISHFPFNSMAYKAGYDIIVKKYFVTPPDI